LPSKSALQVNKVGFERWLYLLAFRFPFLYGLLAVTIAMLAGVTAVRYRIQAFIA
jgi:hypothetical protein